MVVFVRGEDPVLLRDAVRRAVDEAVGDRDRDLVVTENEGDQVDIGALVDAASTPPFLTDRRVVVMRIGADDVTVDQLTPLLEYLADPLDTTELVVAWGRGGRLPKALDTALTAAGAQVVSTGPGGGRGGRREWFDEQYARSGVRLDAAARSLLESTVGEDVSRVPNLLDTLAAVFGTERLDAATITPFLGEAGGVPPWELTDAIDRGDAALAVELVRRVLTTRHALQVMATLTSHLDRMLALDGSDARDERGAAELLGIKGSTFPARKALDGARRLGHDGVVRAVELLADADLALRGASSWEDGLVLEVLVARLARLRRSGAAR